MQGEIDELKQNSISADPLDIYQEVLEKQTYLSEKYADKIRDFSVRYKEVNGIKTIASLRFGFRAKTTIDNRAKTSSENGKKGGRPRDPNATEKSIRRRELRATNLTANKPNTRFGLSQEEI